jgi:valyl-tRNA synthetase
MIMMGLEMTGDVPFRQVYLHGLIRVDGQKMSKTKGNAINPLDLMREYGTDALRLSMVTGTTPGNDTQISNERLEANRNFVNKLWNAGRFVIADLEAWPERDLRGPLTAAPGAESEADRWIVSRANETAAHVTRLFQDFQLGEAARTIHDFLWGEFCDWYLEIAKIELREAESDGARAAIRANLAWVFEHTLRLLHPFAPFVTEELWQRLVRPAGESAGATSIMVASWPSPEGTRDAEAERRLDALMDLVRAIRNMRAEYRVDPGRWVPATLIAPTGAEFFRVASTIIGELPGSRLRPITVVEQAESHEGVVSVVAGGVTLEVPLAGLVDVVQERGRLEREREQTLAEIERSETLLGRPGFVDKARPDVVAKERDKLVGLRERLATLDARLASLG